MGWSVGEHHPKGLKFSKEKIMTFPEQNAVYAVSTYLPKLVDELETANKLRAIELSTRHPNNPIIQKILKNPEKIY